MQEKQPSLNVQIWKRYVDQIDISIVSPTGTRIGPVKEQLGTQRFTVDATEILLYYGEPSPFSTNQELYKQRSVENGSDTEKNCGWTL